MITSWTLDSPLYESLLSVQVEDFGGSMVLQPTILIMARPGNKYCTSWTLDSPLYESFLSV
jgi:hypothetical protein